MRLLLSVFFITVLSLSVHAHDGQHDQWFDGLLVPDTQMKCCSMRDCQPTPVRTKGGHYQAWIDHFTFPDSVNPAEGHAPDTWVDIPESRILRGKENSTGEPIVCWYQKEIRCAVLSTQV